MSDRGSTNRASQSSGRRHKFHRVQRSLGYRRNRGKDRGIVRLSSDGASLRSTTMLSPVEARYLIGRDPNPENVPKPVLTGLLFL